jgi:hypothetical protein
MPIFERAEPMRTSRRDFARLSALGAGVAVIGAYLPEVVLAGGAAPAIAAIDEEAVLASAIFTMSF